MTTRIETVGEGPVAALEGNRDTVATRAESERRAAEWLAAWQARAVPDVAAPLEAEDVARLVRDCFAALDIDPAVGAGFSVGTVHYYRRKDIVDAPTGRTAAARYGLRHVWQAAGARLAGHLGLVTLAEARAAMRGADDDALFAFVAARVADAWARQAMRRPDAEARGVARPLPGVAAEDARAAGTLRPAADGARPTEPATVVRLPGGAWCVLPESHPAHRSPAAARALLDALAAALAPGRGTG